MGDYSDLSILLAESDFEPREREFMGRLARASFEPADAIGWDEPGAYEKRTALRRRAHAELGLPGEVRHWDQIGSEVIDGRRYYRLLEPLPPEMVPPFPRRFADVYRLRRKYGIHATWYAMFSAPDRDGGGYRFLTSIEAARRQFDRNFRGMWRLLLCGTDGPAMEALERTAPPGSAGWENLHTVFKRFPFDHYLSTVELLAGDWGGGALVQLYFCEILYNYDADDEKAEAMVRAERDSVTRVFGAPGRLDPGVLVGEKILASKLHGYSSGGSDAWLGARAMPEWTDKVARYLNGAFDDPWAQWPE